MNSYIDDFLLIKNSNFTKVTNYQNHIEAKKYRGCEYDLNGCKIVQRTAKITPKKIGQFVTLWKRDKRNITAPFCENDIVDFVVIICFQNKNVGHFLFPKKILLSKGILSRTSMLKDGKRGFRVYPKWDVPLSAQAISTQAWQLEYFFEGLDLIVSNNKR